MISEAPPPELPVREETAVAVADTAPPRETAPRADAPTESDPRTDVQAFARRDDAPPRQLYEGDVHQNVQVGNVDQGDVNHIQQEVNHVQQVVVLQYFQLLTIAPWSACVACAQGSPRIEAARAPLFPLPDRPEQSVGGSTFRPPPWSGKAVTLRTSHLAGSGTHSFGLSGAAARRGTRLPRRACSSSALACRAAPICDRPKGDGPSGGLQRLDSNLGLQPPGQVTVIPPSTNSSQRSPQRTPERQGHVTLRLHGTGSSRHEYTSALPPTSDTSRSQ
jgi:hypothetical protein